MRCGVGDSRSHRTRYGRSCTGASQVVSGDSCVGHFVWLVEFFGSRILYVLQTPRYSVTFRWAAFPEEHNHGHARA